MRATLLFLKKKWDLRHTQNCAILQFCLLAPTTFFTEIKNYFQNFHKIYFNTLLLTSTWCRYFIYSPETFSYTCKMKYVIQILHVNKLHMMQGAVHGSSVYSGESHITIHVSVVKCSKMFEEHFLGVEYLYKSNTRLISANRSQVLSAVNHFKHERNCISEVYPIFSNPAARLPMHSNVARNA